MASARFNRLEACSLLTALFHRLLHSLTVRRSLFHSNVPFILPRVGAVKMTRKR